MPKALVSLVAAAVAAAAAASTAAATDSVSTNWAGYAISDAQTIDTGSSTTPLTFTSVTATWKQPKVKCSAGSVSFSAFWVGLGGLSSSSQALEQIGTAANCTVTGKPVYYAWYELVPAASVPVSLKVRPGDTIAASVNVNATNVLVQVKNRTRGTSFTKSLTMAEPDLTSAEWIAEAPSGCTANGNCRVLPLSNFGKVTFTKIAAIADSHPGTVTDPTWAPELIRLVPELSPGVKRSQVGATPSTVSTDGRTFGVAWDPAATP
jgi:Peptidase A4 family